MTTTHASSTTHYSDCLRRLVKIVVFVVAFGCQTTPKYTQAQLNAIETREVDASFDETFNAAASALFDAGYTISMSDRQSGLISGQAGKDKSAERIWISPYIADSTFIASMQIRPISQNLCSVRIKMSANGEPRVDKKAIDNIWNLMQRQVLMKEPVPLEPEGTK